MKSVGDENIERMTCIVKKAAESFIGIVLL